MNQVSVSSEMNSPPDHLVDESDTIDSQRQPETSHFKKKNTFIFFVFIPSLLVGIYYTFFASSQFVAETRLVVRTIGISQQFDQGGEEDSLSSLVGGNSRTQDSYIVANYLQSADLLKKLDERTNLRKLFSDSSIDYFSRLDGDARFDTFHQYWISQFQTFVDGPSGIIIIKIRAFTPEDAVNISNAVISLSEEMINELSNRAQQDLVLRAKRELEVKIEEYTKSLYLLQNYQNEVGILDPLSSAKTIQKIISNLLKEKLELEVQLSSLDSKDGNSSPTARRLRLSIDAINEQIKFQQQTLAGQGENLTQLSDHFAKFADIQTQKLSAEVLYQAAQRFLDAANSTAIKQTSFVSVFSPPILPEESKYPNRSSSILIWFLALLSVWLITTLLWMSIEDHRV